MTRKFFGTDGVRGPANEEPMTAETALKIAMAAGRYFAPETGKQRPLAVIGKDTRLSGYMLEPAMVAGFTAIGMDVIFSRANADTGGSNAYSISSGRSGGNAISFAQSFL